MLNLTAANFTQEVKRSKIPVIVDFWADWCGPCKQFAPILEEFEKEHAGEIKIGKVNVDDEQDVAFRFRVMGIPTLLLFKDGQKVASSTGVLPKADLEAWVKSNI